MEPATITAVVAIVVPVVGAVIGFVLKSIIKRLEMIDADMRTFYKKEDAIREIDRIDRDRDDLRSDINKNLDIIRGQMSELIQAVHELNKRQ